MRLAGSARVVTGRTTSRFNIPVARAEGALTLRKLEAAANNEKDGEEWQNGPNR